MFLFYCVSVIVITPSAVDCILTLANLHGLIQRSVITFLSISKFSCFFLIVITDTGTAEVFAIFQIIIGI
jgi:hypothetical protein